MHKAFGYILILMIGLAVGFFVGAMVSFSSSSQLGTEKQLKLVDIECVQSNYPLLRIILKNDFTERILNGYITIYQGENQWTNEVDWHTDWRNGYGFAGIGCILEENKTLRIKYTENYPKKTYLDRTLQWAQIRIREPEQFTFMETEQLSFIKVEFGTDNTTIVVTVQNTGTADMIITEAQVTGYGVDQIVDMDPNESIDKGDHATITLTLGFSETWSTGKAYNIKLHSSKGNKFPITETA